MNQPATTFDGAPTPAPSGARPSAASFVEHIRDIFADDLSNRIACEIVAAHFYHTYCDAVGGVAWNGDKLPDWPTFCADPAKVKQVQAWMMVAKEALK